MTLSLSKEKILLKIYHREKIITSSPIEKILLKASSYIKIKLLKALLSGEDFSNDFYGQRIISMSSIDRRLFRRSFQVTLWQEGVL